MKVREAIEILREQDPEAEIVLAWWGRDMFDEVPAEDWPEVADHITECMDWSGAHDQMLDLVGVYYSDNYA